MEDARDSGRHQILVALSEHPLDRLRLMKTLFLVWYRSGRPTSGPFLFCPYLYGPYSLDVYKTLFQLERAGLVVQAPHPIGRWGSYYLTEAGRDEAVYAESYLDPESSRRLKETARWAANQTFRSLLRVVYSEAPEFAARSVVREK